MRLPAYAKAIVEARKRGLAPRELVVSLCWNLGKAFHRVVIPDDLPAEKTDLRFCAGLDVWLAYRQDQSEKARMVAEKLLTLNPRRLLSVSVGQSPVLMFLKGVDHA